MLLHVQPVMLWLAVQLRGCMQPAGWPYTAWSTLGCADSCLLQGSSQLQLQLHASPT